MIVIVGAPAWRPAEPAGPAGRTCEIALAAAGRGSRVEVVGRVGDDRVGDELLIRLARAGVGHAALLRDPARPTPLVRAVAARSPDDEDPFADPSRNGTVPPASLVDGPSPRLEPADVRLGLSYLTGFAVLVVSDDAPPDILPAAIDGAAFAGARLVVLVGEGATPPDGVPPDATLLEAPAVDEDAAFGRLVGAYAAGLDAGSDPAAAFDAAVAEGWTAPGS